MRKFMQDRSGFIVSADLAILLGVCVVSALAVGRVLDDYLVVQQQFLTDHITVMCAQFAPGNAPANCANYVQP